ncbi:MAG: hypothetical protein LHW49_06800, partial [Candidatus Cloacimonetes bacterium]|nr:hypothetical protein [Candidatus Cloacimonadota bacterium]
SDLYSRMYKFPTCTPTAIAWEDIISYVQVSDLYSRMYKFPTCTPTAIACEEISMQKRRTMQY